MTDVVIRVENLGKMYRIGRAQQRHDSLRDMLSDFGARVTSLARPNLASTSTNPNSDDRIWALKDVSFEVKRGEVVGVIGRNGAGKSTLLKILSRITEPTEGRARVKGKVRSLLEVGTGFHHELTGRENIYLSGAILGMSKAEIDRRFDEIVDFSGVGKFLDTPVKRYSSGMQVRLGFAVAAHLEPEILLIDEVLAVGDAEFQKKCLGKMEGVAKEGRTVLFVSHNMAAVRNLCDRCVLIAGGTIERIGDTSEIVIYYLQPDKFKQPSVERFAGTNEQTARIVSVEVLPSDTSRLDLIFPGDAVRVRFVVRVFDQLRRLSIGFSMHGEDGRKITNVYSGPECTFDMETGEHIVDAEISSLPLTPGLYTVRGRMEAGGYEIDWPKGDFASFEVSFPEKLYGFAPEVLRNGQLFLQPTWIARAMVRPEMLESSSFPPVQRYDGLFSQ